jgi:hypothetical protein
VYATVRRYPGSDLARRLAERSDEIVRIISETPGFRAYYLLEAGDETVSVTVADDEAGADRSNEIAAGWLRENMPDAAPGAPEISAGEVLITA